MFTRSQVKDSVEVNSLLDTATDCLRFATEFFEVISQSARHIYHSALQLAPRSSIVRKLYSQQIYSPVAWVVAGVPVSWDSCTASVGGAWGVPYAVWSPCGQFIAAAFGGTIQVRDSNTLEKVSVLKPPGHLPVACPTFPTFSPDGRLLACTYYR
jgi:hypothetical protein